MKRYNFPTNIFKWTEKGNEFIEIKNIIKYKCLICGYEHDYDDTWTDAKKEEVQAEVDTHHNDHIIQYE